MHGLVRCKHERRCSRVCGADVSFRDVTIKIPDRGCDQGCEWRHTSEAWAEIWEKSVSWVLPRKKKVDFRLLAEALWQLSHVVWDRWKSCHWKDGYLFSYVEKPLNSKVIKSFISEQRSRKCFCVSGFRCYLYMCVKNILRTFHVFMCGYVTWVCQDKPESKRQSSEW